MNPQNFCAIDDKFIVDLTQINTLWVDQNDEVRFTIKGDNDAILTVASSHLATFASKLGLTEKFQHLIDKN